MYSSSSFGQSFIASSLNDCPYLSWQSLTVNVPYLYVFVLHLSSPLIDSYNSTTESLPGQSLNVPNSNILLIKHSLYDSHLHDHIYLGCGSLRSGSFWGTLKLLKEEKTSF